MRFADYMHLHAMQIRAKMHVLHLAEIGKKVWCIWGPNGAQGQWKTFVNAHFTKNAKSDRPNNSYQTDNVLPLVIWLYMI